MAKKSKRQSSRSSTPTDLPVSPAAGSQAGSAPRSAGFSSSARAAEKEFNPDYTYVIKDLKRIGSLAAFFFAVLIILSIFLH